MNKALRIIISYVFIVFYFFILNFIKDYLPVQTDPLVNSTLYVIKYMFTIPDMSNFLKVLGAYLDIYFLAVIYIPITINYIVFSWRFTDEGAHIDFILKTLLFRSIFTSFFLMFITPIIFILSLKIFVYYNYVMGYSFYDFLEKDGFLQLVSFLLFYLSTLF